ncbi:transposase [Prosthecobacter sp.]|uniref:transposase n=1 Tax=Prosthecobacter sp. TaxID=1965333 RepID=UPI001DCE363B|nr:transposase [Prosthecobacter sp.]MCB1276375.1 transposase [Prosthecobacter sp.]
MLRLNPAPAEHSIQVPDGIGYFDEQKALRIHTRNLPHWRQEAATYFVTFRQIDSIPVEVWARMKREAAAWHARVDLAIQSHGALPPALALKCEAFQRSQWLQAERTADECHGSCLLRQESVRQIVSDALVFFEGTRQSMHAFVVMPNHVHLLVTPSPGRSLDKLTQSWKGFTAREINGHLGRVGALWQQESFDRIVRHSAHFQKIVRYIWNNPSKARMGAGQATVGIAEECLGPASDTLREEPPLIEGDEW